MKHVVEIELAGRRLTLETGRLPKRADGAIWATYGDTVVLATAVASQTGQTWASIFSPHRGLPGKRPTRRQDSRRVFKQEGVLGTRSSDQPVD